MSKRERALLGLRSPSTDVLDPSTADPSASTSAAGKCHNFVPSLFFPHLFLGCVFLGYSVWLSMRGGEVFVRVIAVYFSSASTGNDGGWLSIG